MLSHSAKRCGGSISACAEASVAAPASAAVRRVYLRVCGGIKKINEDPKQMSGLSPRVRRHLVEDKGEQWPTEVYLRVCGGIRRKALA